MVSSWGILGSFKDDIDDRRERIVRSIEEELHALGLGDFVEIRQEEQVDITRDATVNIQSDLELVGRIPLSLEESVPVLKRKVKDLVVDIQTDGISVGLTVGEKAPDAQGLLTGNGETSRVFSMERKGKEYLVLFYQAGHGASIDIALRLKDLGVNVLLISLDECFATFKEFSSNSVLETFSHLWCGEESWSSDIVRFYGIQTVPFGFVVDRSRVVRWVGHPGVDMQGLEAAFRILNVLPRVAGRISEIHAQTDGTTEEKKDEVVSLKWSAVPFRERESLYRWIQSELQQLEDPIHVLVETSKVSNGGCHAGLVIYGQLSERNRKPFGKFRSKLNNILRKKDIPVEAFVSVHI